MNFLMSPFIVPVAALMLAAVAVVSSAVSKAHARRIKAEQRMAMVARGMKAEEIALLLDQSPEELDAQHARETLLGMASRSMYRDPMRSLLAARRTAIILCSVGLGAILFFVLLAHIESDHEIYSGAAAALIPLAIGIGFFIDYHLQKRDLKSLGADVEPHAGA
jgi:hypothetical protein